MNLQNIDNIIFDLGGVIIDIDPQRSFDAITGFSKIKKDKQALFNEQADLFLNYEKGLISDDVFRDGIRKLTDNDVISDQDIDNAWNLMLLQVPLEKLKVLEQLKDRFKIFVLSNTNAIHVSAFNKIIYTNSGKPEINHFFDKVYYSHELNLRKPDLEIYQYVINDENLEPSTTLFIDDRLENIEAAAFTGLQTFHVQPGHGIIEFFKDI